MHLVIVESPTKAKTISKFLHKKFRVESSFGHIRDLPEKSLGVDVKNNFQPTYDIMPRAQKRAEELTNLAKESENIYFATDEDREGEAIAWHLSEIIKPKPEQAKRIVFHEITKSAITEALKHPRNIDVGLVDAQQARRILDRLVGYKLSPLLWKKVAKGLSAGRVQSVAVRIITEREREIEAFTSQEYWTIDAIFAKDGKSFEAALSKIHNAALKKLAISNKEQAQEIIHNLKNATYVVASVEKKKVVKKSPPPFTTSTLQQTANNRLGFSAKQTMMLAQQLYEGVRLGKEGHVGLITYMRTDSFNLSEKFLNEAQAYIHNTLGNSYHKHKKIYKTTSKGAQQAHEAIRPAEVTRQPQSVKRFLDDKQFMLYQLIWQRAVSSQIADAVFDATHIDINDNTNRYTFRASGQILQFDGWLRIYPSDTEEKLLPELTKNEAVDLSKLEPHQHFTQPPPRYTEATLVKALEEKGIGRPSTYAPTLSTIQDRNYVEKRERKLYPTEMGMLVSDLLVKHFPKIVDYEFTAKMEEELDDIEEGKVTWQKCVEGFYTPFHKNLLQKEKELKKKEITESKSDEICEKCGSPMIIKIGRFGKFLACSAFPNCKNTKRLNNNKDNNNDTMEPEKIGQQCPECGKELVKRKGRYGDFVGCAGYPKCTYIQRQPAKEYADCPKCSKGKIIAKRSRRGIFYACNQYPDCKNAYWSAPTGEKCPECASLLLYAKDEKVQCSNKECGFKK